MFLIELGDISVKDLNFTLEFQILITELISVFQ